MLLRENILKNIEDKAIGIMETGKVSSGILALDKTLKSSEVNLVKLQLAFELVESLYI